MTIQANFPAIKPSLLLDFANTKQLDSRITYTRASTASFYNGVTTAMAEQNLLAYSQEFDNAGWVKSATTVTANTIAAPDGTTTADSMFETTATSGHNLGQTITTINGSTYIFSAYVKANGRNFCALYIGGANKGKYFDITAGGGGSVGGDLIGAPTSAALTYVGNDWYRVSITAVVTASSAVQIYSCDTISTFSFTGDVTKGLYLWGAQLEQRSAVTAYTATTTQAITNYIPVLQTAASGVARFDNNPTTGESLGLLIEESRTNLNTYSSQFDNAAYTKISSATITTAANVAPDGTLTAQLFTNGATASRIQTDITVTTATAYTASIYAKAGNASYLCFGFALAPNSSAIFNLSTGVVSNTAGSPTSTSITAVGNGWYRCSITVTSTSTSIRLIAGASSTNTFTSAIYPNGTTGDTGFIWGAQVEAGAFATSYIPTVASQVTRAADAASMTGTNFSSWFNVGQGTVYADGNTKSNTYACLLTVSAATFPIGSGFLLRQLTTNIQFGGYGSSTNSGSVTTNSNVRSAAFYQGLNATSVANGTSVNSITNFDFTGAGTTTLYIGYLTGPSQVFNGTIKKIAYYPFAVTSAQLQALTS